jgi:hypothetical protein
MIATTEKKMRENFQPKHLILPTIKRKKNCIFKTKQQKKNSIFKRKLSGSPNGRVSSS